MLCNEFDLGFILESVKKTIMGFFFGCFRVKYENQNHHIISDSSNKKEKEERRVTVREKGKGRVGYDLDSLRSSEKTPSSTAWHAVSTWTMFTVYYKPRYVVRHPNILSFHHSTEAEIFDGATPKHTTYIVTDPVMALPEKIKELGLEELESELKELEGAELEEQLLQPVVQTQVQIKPFSGDAWKALLDAAGVIKD
ncbi:hypothetical protein C5167_048473 [Papaver somniferum]|uniref:Uncharacterized protein n=1 Tax=Papaver somniferum TaxID=3469 RepID=A0A4Y7KI25_PAPSO|nr:hypothetical protein C5167_048473 [Papaver somniferum]